ncbi:MAG: hypothetical protein GF400_05325 [Candidatus Eisenbacteria bacterium]|nr:hypothetical protein [Candidatus Eisenbacteria bacterium]
MSSLARSFVWCLTVVLAGSLAPARAIADHIDHAVTFARRDLTVEQRGAYHVVDLRGCELTERVGEPQLPVLPVALALPEGARVLGVDVVASESREYAGPYRPFPAQEPAILPVPGVELPGWVFTEPNDAVYEADSAYPPVVAEIASVGRVGGNTAVGIKVYPVQYLPSAGKLRLFTRLELRVEYEGGIRTGERDARRAPLRELASGLLANPDEVAEPREKVGDRESRVGPGDYEYVIVTDPGYLSSFQPLADWKSRKGVPATIVTTDWIHSNYDGADAQARIRAFIADAYSAWGSVWFLLGGDTQVIPARRAYAMTCEAGGHALEDEIGCDLYYSDLDGTWDEDGDGVYGEVEDAIDLYPDVFVGRASARTNAHVQAFVEKTLRYEQNPHAGIGLDMLMAGEVLWNDPFTDSGIGLNMIDREHVPPRYDPITKLYETLGNESDASVIDALDDGPGYFFHNGHAWFTVMGCGDGYLDRAEVDGLENGLRAPVVYSIGCWPAAFDLEGEQCIAEHFVRNADGGALAFIGNSRYGWGSPGNPGYGYSERYMEEFCRRVFTEGPRNLGSLLAAAKAEFVPFSQSENVYRWHQYEVNLLGDPEMPLWTDEPAPLEVSHPDSVAAGLSEFGVSVWTSGGPVAGALVCVRNGSDVYERGTTEHDGSASLDLEIATPESLDLTITAADCRPYTSRIGVSMSGAFVQPEQVTVDDSYGGNGDGLAGPGETVELAVSLRNLGDDDAAGVEATVSTEDTLVQVVSASASYGDVSGGAVVPPSAPFLLTIAPDCPDGHAASLELAISEAAGRENWSGTLTVTVASPVVSVDSYSVDDIAGGDGDGSAEPGEAFRLLLELANEGLAAAREPSAQLASLSSEVQVVVSGADLSDIEPGDRRRCVFEVEVSPGCPSPFFPRLTIEVATSDGHALVDTFGIAVGQTGMVHDFEDGASGWSHSGQNDLWALTDNRSHSGTMSWYSGDTSSWEYHNNMEAQLVSPEFVAGVDTELRFWCWYELPIYHEDGVYIELLSEGAPVDTLDFIGSGGALNHLGSIGNDWLEYSYQLGRAPGETLSVRFRFRTDESDVAEGVYIDDVTVTSAGVPTDTGVHDVPEVAAPAKLHQNRPNPFTKSTTIGFSMHREAPVVLSVYNIQGRLIDTIADDVRGIGEHSVVWDGKDELGADVAAGVYLYRLTIGDYEDAGKMILVR